MKKLVLLLSFTCPVPTLAQEPLSDHVTVALSMRDDAALTVRYSVPAGCTSLRFLNTGINPGAASAMRQDWKSADDNATVSATGISFTGTGRSASIVVPAVARDIDRVYPWAHPLDSAIYSHTSAYAVQPDCGPLHWQFQAEKGTVVVDGKVAGPSVTIGAGQNVAYSPVVFLAGAAALEARKQRYIDRRFPNETAVFLRRSTTALSAYFARRFQPLKVAAPFIVAVPTAGGSGWRGDVANNNTMRLMLNPAPSAEERKQLASFIAHEASHLLQPVALNEHWAAEATLINEGGAEFMSWLATAELGWADGASLAERAQGAVNACILGAGNKPWQSDPGRNWGRAPYDCGLAVHLIGLANGTSGAGAVPRLAGFYADAAAGKGTDFAQALECGADSACRPQWLPALLGKERPLAAVIDDFSQTSRWLKRSEHWTGAQIDAVARALLGRLMAFDCQGQVSMFTPPQMARIGSVGQCATLMEGMVIIKAEGRALFSDRAAARDIVAACTAKGSATLGLQDGRELILPCSRKLSIPAALYSVSVKELLSALAAQK